MATNSIGKIIRNLINIANNNKLFYFGFSIIRKEEIDNIEYGKVLFSVCVCKSNNKYEYCINNFKNIIYKENFKCKIKNIKEIKHLKYLLNNKCNDFKSLYRWIKKYNNSLYIVFFSDKKNTKSSSLDFLRKYNLVNNGKIKYLKNFKSTHIIKNKKVVFIFDIKRPMFDKRKHFEDMNVVVDTLIISAIKEISNSCNFKAVSHTGDGFVMIYDGEYLLEDLRNLFLNLKELKRDLFEFLEGLLNFYKDYRIRGIISEINIYKVKIENTPYLNEVYMSSELDGLFKKMKASKKVEEEFFYDINNKNKKFFILVDKNLNLKNNKIFSFTDNVRYYGF